MPVVMRAAWVVILGFLGVACGSAGGSIHPQISATDQLSTAGWTVDTFAGSGVRVTLEHPSDWARQLHAYDFHYHQALGLLANWPLHEFCHIGPSPGSCVWNAIGTPPPSGVIVGVGTAGYGPGLSLTTPPGLPLIINGRRAGRSAFLDGRCGAAARAETIAYGIEDGLSQGYVTLDICFIPSGNARLTAIADQVAHTVRIQT